MPDPSPTDPAEHLTRGQQLARDLLEEMDKPTSPERLAQLAAKDEADARALALFYVETGQCPPPVEAAPHLREAAEVARELADVLDRLPLVGPFDPMVLPFAGPPGRKATLEVAPSPRTPSGRFVEMTIYTTSGISRSSRWLIWGTNAEVAAYLRAPQISSEIETAIEEGIQSLDRNRLA